MGVCANKSQSQPTDPPQNQRLQRIYQQYVQVSNINHPLNVNHKYNNYFTLLPDKFSGQGIKKTNSYTSRLTREEWLEKKKEFWGKAITVKLDSRIEGESQFWLAIKKALEEPDENQVLAILSACDLKLINNSLQLLYDSRGHKFDVPVFMINEPQSFPTVKQCDLNLIEDFEENSFKLKIRSTKLTKDCELTVNSKMTISNVKKSLIQATSIENNSCRLFWNGRELQDHHLVGNYQLNEGFIIQAFM